MVECPNCGYDNTQPADGMCANSGNKSGDQIHCVNCGVWFVDPWDGRRKPFIDGFLTATVQPNEPKIMGKGVRGTRKCYCLGVEMDIDKDMQFNSLEDKEDFIRSIEEANDR